MIFSHYKIVIQADKRPVGSHKGRYNAPQANDYIILIIIIIIYYIS